LIAGILAGLIGIISYRQMRDRPGVSLMSDVVAALRGELGAAITGHAKGVFISFEGGEGCGKSTQSKLLKEYLEEQGHTVTLTREPGGTKLGKELRDILLHTHDHVSPRAEALLYAADRAHHVETLIRPALERGEIVITDRYLDSSIAYQGAGRVLSPGEVGRISRWATESLIPTLTIIIDLPAEIGLGRLKSRDRLESESTAFHERVRQEFLSLAVLDPERYIVVDGRLSVEEIAQAIAVRVSELRDLNKIEKQVKEKKKIIKKPTLRKKSK
jgi:dTMP kinase